MSSDLSSAITPHDIRSMERADDSMLSINAVIVDAQGGFEVDNVLVVPSEPGYQSTPQEIQELITAIQTDDANDGIGHEVSVMMEQVSLCNR